MSIVKPDPMSFRRNRSVEAQSEVVATLNDVVIKAMEDTGVSSGSRVLLPTGDGIAIALIDVAGIDIHLQLALEILRLIAAWNSDTSDPMRQFEVRIGINENIDNIVLDINGRRNVAGAGISMAQRIMDKADGGQILLGSSVYEILRQREKYLSSFRGYNATGKHGVKFSVYQFLSKNTRGLNVAVPSAFAVHKAEPLKLTKLVAYFIAHAERNREFLLSRRSDPAREYVGTVLLYFLAADSQTASETPSYETPTTMTWEAGIASFEQQYSYYDKLDLWTMMIFSQLISTEYLEPYREHFETNAFLVNIFPFIKPSGLQKLQAEWPDIANEFGIEPRTA